MTDLISRADAIEAVAQEWLFEASAESPYVNDDDIGEYRKLAEELFEDVPSAEAEQGEWIEHKGEWIDFDFYPTKYECSQCHYYVDEGYDSIFCPNCGADMRGEKA